MSLFSLQKRSEGPKQALTQILQYDLDEASARHKASAVLQRFYWAVRLNERERSGMLWQIAN